MATAGKEEERLAAEYLVRQGLRILFRNWHCQGGELDLVAWHAGELVFVEVRYRGSATWGDAVESVGALKRRRWQHAARCFCAQHPEFKDAALRFDLVAIQGDNKTIEWIQDVLRADERFI